MSKGKFYKIICPYCCHKFEPSQVHFRLHKDIKSKNLKKELDEKLFNYNVSIKALSESAAKEQSIKPKWVTLEDENVIEIEEELEKYGFSQNIIYKTENSLEIKTDIRLCPNCHNELHTGAGLRDTKMISIIGDSRVGKSTYLTALIQELSNNKDFKSRLNFIGDIESKNKFYDDYQKPLLEDKIVVPATERKKIPPFAYNYWYQYKGQDGVICENVIDLIFYDIAGEDVRQAETIKKNGFNIKDSDGIIYLVDPTNFSKMNDIFRLTNKTLLDIIPKENKMDDVLDAMYNYFLGSDIEKSKIPIAVVVSKADLFKNLDINYFKDKPNSRIILEDIDESHNGYLRYNSIQSLNMEVKEMLGDFGEEKLINSIFSNFQHVSTFAVSSLGQNPKLRKVLNEKTMQEEQQGYIEEEIMPFRVKEPFYWIMAKNSLLFNFQNGYYYKDGEEIHINKQPKKNESFFSGLLVAVKSFIMKR